ncbi:MAG: hypothetical protein RR234_00225, partial [Christensenella sp.]
MNTTKEKLRKLKQKEYQYNEIAVYGYFIILIQTRKRTIMKKFKSLIAIIMSGIILVSMSSPILAAEQMITNTNSIADAAAPSDATSTPSSGGASAPSSDASAPSSDASAP